MANNTVIFQFIGNTVTNTIAKFLEPAASNITAIIAPITATGVSLYLVLFGYMIIAGKIQQPYQEFIIKSLKIIFIAAFALNFGNYNSFVKGSFEGLESGLSAAISGAPSENIYQTLDNSFNKGLNLVGLAFEKANKAGLSNIGSALSWIITGIVIALSTLAISLIGAGVIIVAKFALAIMFALGPIFIMALLFPVTARFFDNWFSQVMNYVLTIVIMAAIMTFSTAAFDQSVAAADFSGDGQGSPLFAALEIAALSGILVFITYQAGGMASGLAGGVSMTAMTLRQMADGLLAPGKAVSNQMRHNRSERDRKRQLAHYDKADKKNDGGSVENQSGGAAYKSGLARMMQRLKRPG
ncbi:MAG: type IV secretion system protein [Candidatus Cloacimonetes bacterium]|nr:type IV secretion system protein [Candidatus Cloacimonadota bacterium]